MFERCLVKLHCEMIPLTALLELRGDCVAAILRAARRLALHCLQMTEIFRVRIGFAKNVFSILESRLRTAQGIIFAE